MKKTILIYGLVLAALIFLLEYFEYRYFVRDLSTEAFVFIIALMFAGLGLWVGQKLTAPKRAPDEFQKNEKALDFLGISERELEVLELVAEGLSNKEIAGKLFVSINTVKTHLSRLYEKLEVNRRTQAVEKAKSLRLIK
ncbi:MAG: response regulator transcription factor [Balneolaceae bacterium]|nr:response regulator transcription factor [Balneolaceae bacterium]MBO6544902.1 response regulator transcription factor [Balneolaceae bacterium]MBO6646298.1 response regulator transcription factor [Balneolaceae bacterium]